MRQSLDVGPMNAAAQRPKAVAEVAGGRFGRERRAMVGLLHLSRTMRDSPSPESASTENGMI